MKPYDAEAADEIVRELKAALIEIQKIQGEMVDTLRKHGIRFTDIGADPQDWQHVAFTIYSRLCETEAIARNALTALTGAEPNGKGS